MITNNVIQRVFHINYQKNLATCFAIDYADKQYLVTAKHVIKDLQDNNLISLYFDGKWNNINAHLIGHHETADVSVISCNQIMTVLELEPTLNGLAYGQDVYFLGFPFGLLDKKHSVINRNFPIPLVKKAIMSGVFNDEYGKYLLLDGFNNQGFSGGPVVFQPIGEKRFKVAGIISGFRYAKEPTYIDEQETELIYKANTGIIIAYLIDNAIELILKNPTGLTIKATH
jgi:hypothetical protein